ncbi:hypothetical protein NRB_26120 [Novosphingobium sp. 11B]
MIDAESLHGWLANGRPIPSWFRKVMDDYEFGEGRDYFPETEKRTGGRPRKDYLLTTSRRA